MSQGKIWTLALKKKKNKKKFKWDCVLNMPINRALLFYISVNSGHQMAGMAIDEGIRMIGRNIETLNINYFRYTNPMLAGLIMKTYHGMLKRKPELWNYLYDNDGVKKKTAKFRSVLHKFNSVKLKRLIEWYRPDIIVCTQAFPCAAMAEYKRINKTKTPIVGVVTDYGVHSYWADPDVDLYVVPNQEGKDRLKGLGIDSNKIEIIGIPIFPKFSMPLDNEKLKLKFGLNGAKPVVLVMGGSQGMISMDEIVKHLTKLSLDMHLIVVCGVNKPLYKRLKKIQKKLNIGMHLYEYVNNVEELMSVADLIITKPGGITVAESLAKGLPMVIVNPIPGQEQKNTDFLLKNNTAVKAKDAADVARQVRDLINNPGAVRGLKQSIGRIAQPKAALEIAERIVRWGN